MILICTNFEARGGTPRERRCRGAAANVTKVEPRHELLVEHCGRIEIDHRDVGCSEQRRRKMIRDTERYLNNPHSKPWARLSRMRTCAVPASARVSR